MTTKYLARCLSLGVQFLAKQGQELWGAKRPLPVRPEPGQTGSSCQFRQNQLVPSQQGAWEGAELKSQSHPQAPVSRQSKAWAPRVQGGQLKFYKELDVPSSYSGHAVPFKIPRSACCHALVRTARGRPGLPSELQLCFGFLQGTSVTLLSRWCCTEPSAGAGPSSAALSSRF